MVNLPEPTKVSSRPPTSTVRRSIPVPPEAAGIGYSRRVTLIDRLYQVAYRVGYQLVRLLWLVFRPTTHGALVIVWKDGALLLVRNSYVSYFSPPGGYVRGGETAQLAAIRELAEETGLNVRPDQLTLCHEETHHWEYRRDHVTIYDVEVTDQVKVRVDHREVVSAGFYTPEEALTLNLFPPLRRRLERYLADRSAHAIA